MKQRKSRNYNRCTDLYLPIFIACASVLIIRIVILTGPSPEICRWVYSTIIQAFAAMVALVGMFAIYTLQLLTHKYENDVKELIDSIRHREKEKMRYHDMWAGRSRKSLDFINEGDAIENERKEVIRDEEFIESEERKIYSKGKEETIGHGNKRIGIKPEDGEKFIRLTDWKWAVEDEKRILDRVKREKDTMTWIKKSAKIPLIASGSLIGISLFLLSFSQKSIIHSAQSLFFWFFAGIIGAAVCLTYMLIREILDLIKI